MELIINNLATELSLQPKQINTVLTMLGDGATVPFIARYRKDQTGNLDEEQIRAIEKQFAYAQNLQNRKEEVIRLIEEKGLLTPELTAEINAATKLSTIEDLYMPYKEKKKTKATTAIAAGLEPLAKMILSRNFSNLEKAAQKFVNENVESVDKALEGAGYIISEWISENAKTREMVRDTTIKYASVEVKAKRKIEELDPERKYEMYYDFAQKVNKVPGYRILAFNRGEREKKLNVKIAFDIDWLTTNIMKYYARTNDDQVLFFIDDAVRDSLKRLICPSIERETRNYLTEKAESSAIGLFSENLDKLIMQPPCKDSWILGVDPAYRTGCKLAVINPQGKLEKIDVIYPHPMKGQEKRKEELWKKSIGKLNKIAKEFKIDQIVIGNGTASRETETFFKQKFAIAPIHIISEAGASVYSASKLAQEEFPDLAVEERSAASIARRYQDPMSELVKIDPQSIGVGQYQHDVNQKVLTENLNFVMLKNINQVGVDLNTASVELLKYVSGLDRSVAKNIVEYRNENGKFESRKQLLEVKRLGKKAFEQCAGFLKIADGINKLDATFIHPENYKLATAILKEIGHTLEEVGTEAINDTIKTVNSSELATAMDANLIVVSDILKALTEPMLDIRENVNNVEFDTTVSKIEDLEKGMIVTGQVRNIVEFGAFVDIGVKNDGLIHISQLSNNYIKSVRDVVNIGDVIKVAIKDIDLQKNKVQLSLKDVK
ncbi:Tex family protein [Mollicutes bacterium LVI A0078]|nr:Tex family protein [Mollicutes bacterium LVI A0075]WOO90922.1 Tex family protein [Mollicutes bacterium LVI A0078]